MTSKPKIAARDRMLAVGVEGRELFPVENLNSPYWWTINEQEVRRNYFNPDIVPHLSVLSDQERVPFE